MAVTVQLRSGALKINHLERSQFVAFLNLQTISESERASLKVINSLLLPERFCPPYVKLKSLPVYSAG